MNANITIMLMIKGTISFILINSLLKFLSDSLLSDSVIRRFVIRQFKEAITLKVVV